MGHVCNIEQSDARCWVYFLADLVSRRPEGRPMQSVLDDPKLWHDCAADACVTAEQMIDPDSKRLMLGIADGYRQLSRRSEERRPRACRRIQVRILPIAPTPRLTEPRYYSILRSPNAAANRTIKTAQRRVEGRSR